MSGDRTWTVEWMDGRTESVYGEATVRDGVLTIAYFLPYGGPAETYVQYPISVLRKWAPKL